MKIVLAIAALSLCSCASLKSIDVIASNERSTFVININQKTHTTRVTRLDHSKGEFTQDQLQTKSIWVDEGLRYDSK